MSRNNRPNTKNIRKIILKDFERDNFLRRGIIYILVIASSFFNIALAWVMQAAINTITDNNGMEEMFSIFIKASVCIVSCILIQYTCERMKNSYVADFSVYVKEKMFKNLMKKNIIEYEDYNSGDYSSAFQTDILKLSASYVTGRWSALSGVSLCLMGIVSMLSMSMSLSLVVLLLQVVPVFLTLFLGRKLPEYEANCAELRGVFAAETHDYLKGFRTIKTFSSENVFLRKFSLHNINLETSANNMRNKSITIDIINDFSMNVMTIILFLVGGIEVIRGKVNIGTIIACFELYSMISGPLSGLTATINLIRSSNGIFERIYKLFYVSAGSEIAVSTMEQKIKLPYVHRIELKNVFFSYEGNDNNVLKNINISFEDNKKYAIVGNSGSGKSTLIKLILGYYPEYKGDILFDAQELGNVDLESLSKALSIVQQEVFIFNDTIRSNIIMGAAFSEEQVDMVIEKAGLSAFIAEHGEDYLCGEDGKNLSGGEKQRISIARALLKNSKVIFFDEATSSLDNFTAIEIENTINSLERICVAITHRLDLNILRKYDEVLVFSNGEIVEKGTADELMELEGEFFKLYTSTATIAQLRKDDKY